MDTSTLIDFLKGNSNESVDKFEKLLTLNYPFAISSVIYQEVIQGAKDEKEFKKLSDFLSTQFIINPKDPVLSYEEAARIYFRGRRKGITIRSLMDCLIAQTAIEYDFPLLHNDRDFDDICKITSLKVL